MIQLEDLRNATGGQLFGSVRATSFTGLCPDAERIQPGQLFVARQMHAQDTHNDIQQAIDAGAAGVLCERPPTGDVDGVTVVMVGDARAAMGQWAAYILRQHDTTVIGMFGPHRLPAHAITELLRQRFDVHYDGTVPTGVLGIAMALEKLEASHHIVVLDLTPSHPGELDELMAIAQPHLAVVTGAMSRRDVRKLTDAMPSSGMMIMNGSDPALRSLQGRLPLDVTFYGESDQVAVQASEITYRLKETTFTLRMRETTIADYQIRIPGPEGVNAVLAGLACGLLYDFPGEEMRYQMAHIEPRPGQWRVLSGQKALSVVDHTYHASAENVLAALDWFRGLDTERRRLAVLGTIEADEPTLRQIGEAAAGMDILVAQGEQARRAMLYAREAGLCETRTRLAYRPHDSATAVLKAAEEGDAVLVIGGRKARMEHVIGDLLPNQTDPVWLLQRRSADRDQGIAARSNSWVEIDLDALATNTHQLKERLGGDIEMMAVVAGDGYGHGATEVAATVLHNGASMLGVRAYEEALALRKAGISAPVLVFGYTPVGAVTEAIKHDIMLSVIHPEYAKSVVHAARALKREASVHVNVDTGASEFGVLPEDVPGLIREIIRSDYVKLAGIFTHFAAADDPVQAAYTNKQLEAFNKVVASIKATGLEIPYLHAANSAALLEVPQSLFNMVRPGLLLYGLSPSTMVPSPGPFRRVLTWKSRLTQIKTLEPGAHVGYGTTQRLEKPTRIGLIPVGHADGLSRFWGNLLVRGKRVRIIGGSGIHGSVLDLMTVPEAQVGDEVVLIGQQGGNTITMEDVALRLRVSNYQVTTRIAPHIPRINQQG